MIFEYTLKNIEAKKMQTKALKPLRKYDKKNLTLDVLTTTSDLLLNRTRKT